MGRQPRGAELPHARASSDRPPRAHETGDDLLLPAIASDAPSTRASPIVRHRSQDVLDLFRLHLAPRDVDERRDPAGERRAGRVASNRPKSPVRKPSPSPSESNGSLAGVPPTPPRRRPRGRARRPRGAPSSGTRVIVTPGTARPHWSPRRRCRAVVEGDAAGFAGAVERVNLHAERAVERAHGRCRLEPRPGADQHVETGAATRRAAGAHEVVEHERHAREHARAVRSRVADELVRARSSRAARSPCPAAAAASPDCRCRRRATAGIAAIWQSAAGCPSRVMMCSVSATRCTLGRERGLGQAGRPRCELQHRGTAQVDLRRRRSRSPGQRGRWRGPAQSRLSSAAAALAPSGRTMALAPKRAGERRRARAQRRAGVDRHERQAERPAGEPQRRAARADCRPRSISRWSRPRPSRRSRATAVRRRVPDCLRPSASSRVSGRWISGRRGVVAQDATEPLESRSSAVSAGAITTVSPSPSWRRCGPARSGADTTRLNERTRHQRGADRHHHEDREQRRRDQAALEPDVQQDQLHHAARVHQRRDAERRRAARPGQRARPPSTRRLCRGRRPGTRRP